MGGSLFIDIILLALIAGFIALRLRSVLGQKTDADDERIAARKQRFAERLRETDSTVVDGEVVSNAEARALEAYQNLPARLRSGVEGIRRIEPTFNPNEFIDGARTAYGMILDGYWRGDKDSFGGYLADDIRRDFFSSIDEREREKLSVENRLLETRTAEISDVQLNERHAEITVRFISDIVMLTRDKDGNVVDGDETDSVEILDIWTFSRELGSKDPNWLLIETRAD